MGDQEDQVEQIDIFGNAEPVKPPTADPHVLTSHRFSARELRAIRHYLTAHPELRLALQSMPGVVQFHYKAGGMPTTKDIRAILAEYDVDRREAAQERARTKRQEAQR